MSAKNEFVSLRVLSKTIMCCHRDYCTRYIIILYCTYVNANTTIIYLNRILPSAYFVCFFFFFLPYVDSYNIIHSTLGRVRSHINKINDCLPKQNIILNCAPGYDYDYDGDAVLSCHRFHHKQQYKTVPRQKIRRRWP